jgi:hypothetical protein
MAFTKDIALHDSISIDGNDVSNAFRTFGFTSDDAQVDVSGFSVTGTEETLQGVRSQTLEGEAFYTPELFAILYPLYNSRSVFFVSWQPDGLIDGSREIYEGNVHIFTFNPNATRGDVRVMTCTFKAADSAGIYVVGT